MDVTKMTAEQRSQARKEADKKFQTRVLNFKTTVDKAYYTTLFDLVPERYKRTWLDCFDGKANKRKAIAAKCYECAGYEDTQNNVGGCTARTCPLWQYRPLQPKK